MKTLITNGTLVTDIEVFPADVLIDGGKIAAIGSLMEESGCEVVDASGMYLLPGGVDVHTHLALPMFGTMSSDDHYTGHKAAAFGGTTTVLDFISQDSDDLAVNLAAWQQKALALAAVDYSFHMNLTHFTPHVAEQIPQLTAWGIPSVKMFTAYNGRLRLQDGEIFQVMRICREYGILPMLHAENGDVIEVLVREALAAGHTAPIWHARTRPAWAAAESSWRGIALAAMAESPLYLVHMNSVGEVEQLRLAREKGLPVFGETCPPYLFFTEEELLRQDGAKWVCSPPLRTHKDQEALWQGLEDGVLQTIGTDHCPFFFNGAQPILYEGEWISIPGKELGVGDFTKIPNGLPGVGDRMPILWSFGVQTGRLTPQQFVALTSTNPAKLFGMYPQKGSLLPGTDADLVIWDPSKELVYGASVAQHRTDTNLYEGWQLRGFPHQVYLRGQLIVDQGRWKGRRGMGSFIARSPFTADVHLTPHHII